jgi:hypothetical protein
MRYRLRGEIVQYNGGTAALFDVQTPEIFTSRYDMTMPWMTDFGEDYYSYKSRQLSEAVILDSVAEYNNEPNLQPTALETVSDNIQQLIKKLQK